MPVKRRASKRRIDPRAEAEVWSDLFETGFDFFGDVAEHTGLTEPVNIRFGDQREQGERVWREAAEQAWRRLGGLYLQAHGPLTNLGEPIWALEQFGEPARAD